MRRFWVPTVIAVAMAVMFWQVPFYESPVNAATGELGAFEICEPGWIPESVLFHPSLTTEIYARRFLGDPMSRMGWICEDGTGHPVKAECCYRLKWSGCPKGT